MWIVYHPDTLEIVKTAYTIKSAKFGFKCKQVPTNGWFGLDKAESIEKWKTFKLLAKRYD